jgi:hypothetical protein
MPTKSSRGDDNSALGFAPSPKEGPVQQTATTARGGMEHWTHKGDVRLFLWNKPAARGTAGKGAILFVHCLSRLS